MTTFLSGDPTMYKAYNEGKDLYAMIAMSAFDNNYEDNLEFYREFCEVDLDGKKVIAGSGKEIEIETDNTNSIIVPTCYLLSTDHGELPANEISLQDKIKSDSGYLEIVDIVAAEDTIINGAIVRNLKFTFKSDCIK